MNEVPLIVSRTPWGPEDSDGQLTVTSGNLIVGLVEWDLKEWTLEPVHKLFGEDCQGRFRAVAVEALTGRVALGLGDYPREAVENLKKNIKERYWEGPSRCTTKEWNPDL